MKTIRASPKLLGALVGLAMMGMAGTADATLLLSNDTDFNFLGAAQDGSNITTDVDNDLEWLDWTLTGSRTYNDVSTDPLLFGWRYATSAEFIDLILATGTLIPTTDTFSTPINADLITLSTALGCGQLAPCRTVIGFFDESFSVGTHALGGFFIPSATSFCTEITDTVAALCLNPTFADAGFGRIESTIGHALVRSVIPVPEPSSMLLFGAGLIALVGIGRRRRRKDNLGTSLSPQPA